MNETITSQSALTDLDYAFGLFKSRHPIWLETTEEALQLQKQLTSLYQNKREVISQQENISVQSLYQHISEIFAILQDGHTRCAVYSDDEISIDDFTPLYALGNPVAINGIDINQLYEVFKTRFSYEVDIAIKKRFFSSYVFRTDLLSLIGIDTTKPVTMTYQTKDGYEDFTHNFVPHTKSFYPKEKDIKTFLKSKNYSDEEITKITESALVESLTPDSVKTAKVVGDTENWFWYTIDSENDLGIFTLSQCHHNNDYIKALKNFFKDVTNANITNVAVDLRGNGGGNSMVANEFIKHLNVDSYNSWDCAIRVGNTLKYYTDNFYKNEKYDTNFSGNVYILTNTNTYSAAMDFAMLIQDNNLGKIIGEPSSNKPESYGDILQFQLPTSKLAISISFKKWYRIDQTKKDLLIEPDIPCPANEAVSVLYDLVKS